MDNSAQSKRSRRRFLADMLFVGGGLSAAALLAKSQFGHTTPTETNCDPGVAGAPEPIQVNDQPTEHPPMPGEPMPATPDQPVPSCTKAPQPDGGMELPPAQEPQIEGRMVAPNPAGGARARY